MKFNERRIGGSYPTELETDVSLRSHFASQESATRQRELVVAIGRQLRSMYEIDASRPGLERFDELLRRLDQREQESTRSD